MAMEDNLVAVSAPHWALLIYAEPVSVWNKTWHGWAFDIWCAGLTPPVLFPLKIAERYAVLSFLLNVKKLLFKSWLIIHA